MRKTEFTYTIQNTFDYKSGQQAKTILLKAPNHDCRHLARQLQQKLCQPLNEIDSLKAKQLNDKQTIDSDDEKGQAFLMLLMMSKSVDFADFADDIESLLISGCALINGVDKFEQGYFNKIGFEESNHLIGEYLQNFLLPSAILNA